MNEPCKDCVHIGNMLDKIKSLWHAYNDLKDKADGLEKRVKDLEISSSENKKDFDRIFDAIEEIKGNLSKIANCIEAIQLRNAKKYENLGYEIVKYLVIAGVAAAVAKLF